MSTLRISVMTAALLLGAGYAHAVPKQILDGWKSACAGEGMRTCCQNKVNECQAGCGSGSGNAATSCRNDCAAGFSTCTSKSIRVAGKNPVKNRPVVKSH